MSRVARRRQISRNPSIGPRGEASGRLEILLPYDGFKYFTRDAVHDVGRYLRRQSTSSDVLEAVVGHLAFVNYQDTNLSDVLELDSRLDAYPLRIPIPTGTFDPMDVLAAGRHEYRMRRDHLPLQEAARAVSDLARGGAR